MNILEDSELLEFTANQESQSVCPAKDFLDSTVDRMRKGVAVYGDSMPWQRTKDKFRFRPGEVTIWAGVNGNGKSLVMGQCALWLIPHTSVLIASMEMKPEATMGRMVRQAAGVDNPTEGFIRGFFAKTENLWIYDQVDTVESDRILAVCHWAATKCGVKHIMIDSMVKCGIGPDDYSRQKTFVDRLCWVAKRYNIHVHLVVHIRKGKNEAEIPTKWDIKGAGEITDLADNVLIVGRNAGKEKRLREAPKDEYGAPDVPEEVKSKPDCYIRVAKQRHGEWEGLWGFWWHEKSQQWIPKQGAGAMPWPNPDERIFLN